MALKTGYHDAVLSETGQPIVATVTVYLPGTQTLAVIYTAKEGTVQKDNPFQTDALGRFQFFADWGFYDLEVSGTGITTFKIEDIFINPAYEPFTDVRDYE